MTETNLDSQTGSGETSSSPIREVLFLSRAGPSQELPLVNSRGLPGMIPKPGGRKVEAHI
jgi:hypothetical protein